MTSHYTDLNFNMRAVRRNRVMNGSTAGLISDIDNISLGQDQASEFSMQVLMVDSKQETSEMSSGLKRSISDAVERNLIITALDLHEACREGNFDIARSLLENDSQNVNELDDHGLAPLHYGCRHDHGQIVQLLLNCGADPNLTASSDNRLHTPAHFASWFNALQATNVLIDNKANLECSAAFGQKPLHYAACRASPELVKTLLTRGRVDPQGRDNQQYTPLHLAAQRGRLDVIKVLFAHGADLSAKNDEDEMALHFAAREGHREILKHLLQRAAMSGFSCKELVNSKNFEMKTCLQLAVEGGHIEAVKICIEYGAEVFPPSRQSIPLHIASTIGHLEMVKFLLSQNAISLDEEDDEGMTAILRASLAGHVDVIEHLQHMGARICPLPGSTAPSPLMCAVKRGHRPAIEFLLQHGSPIDLRDSGLRTCLHVAVYSADLDTVDIILKNGGESLIDSVDRDNRTPLHYAAAKGSFQIVQKLLDFGASVVIKDEEEKLPIVMATECGSLKCVKALLEANPKSLHSTEFRLRTPLHYAACEGHVHLVKFFLDLGASIDQRDENHLTPLLMAARLNKCETATLLLDRGAKIEAVSKNRSSPIDVAAYFGNPKIVKLLLDRGANVTSNCVFGKGCLDAALKGSKADTCLEIVKHKRWKEALEVKDDKGFCMLKQLIEKFPDVAKVAMDKCIEYSDHRKVDPEYSKTYNFVFLDPLPHEQTNAEGERYFGPKLMLDHGYRDLLLHPLTEELMRVKRNIFRVKYFYLTALFYVIFTVSVTSLLLCLNVLAVPKHSGSNETDSQSYCSQSNLNIARGITGSISLIFLLSHCYRIYCEKWTYWANISNSVELAAFTTSLITVSGRELGHGDSFEISAGVFAVILTYITFLTYMQGLFKAGIYITMLIEVQRRLLLVIAVFFLLLLSFALVFHVLLSREANAARAGITLNEDIPSDPFGRIDLSMLKILDMMIGEVEYTSFFVDKMLFLPEVTRFVFALFCFMIPIAFMNLLIGLAVGDIEAIQRNAELRLLAVEIEDYYTFECRLPLCVLRRIHRSSVTKYLNKKNCLSKKGFTSILRIMYGPSDNSTLEVIDDSFEQTATAFFKRMHSLEGRVEKLSATIETQTEMLEKVVKMLATKEINDDRADLVDPLQQSSTDELRPSSMDQTHELLNDQFDHSSMASRSPKDKLSHLATSQWNYSHLDQLDQLPRSQWNHSRIDEVDPSPIRQSNHSQMDQLDQSLVKISTEFSEDAKL